MLNAEDNKIVLLGFPSAGKSTFLVALWHVVEKADVPNSMILDTIQGDNEYITGLRTQWLSCTPLERTKRGAKHNVTLILRHPQNNRRVRLVIPDVAGELFDEHWQERVWSEDYVQSIEQLNGIVLLLNAEQIKVPEGLVEYRELLEGIDAEDDSQEQPQMYEPSLAGLQAKTVDILQQHVAFLGKQVKISVAVIISAWDTVENHSQGGLRICPEAFLQQRAPLIWQFLLANPEFIQFKTYGISALGGNLVDDSERLLDLKPSERIIVDVDGIGDVSHDISLPIQWLIDFRSSDA